MNTTEYLLSAVLILVVVLQIRGRKLTAWNLITPFLIVGYATFTYLHSLPTSGNDPVLVLVGIAAGLTLGCLSGLVSLVYFDTNGVAYVRATWLAAGLWILGVGSRLAFSLYAQHGGGASIVRFTSAHALTNDAWAAALILMALTEVVTRTLVLVVRSRRLAGGAGAAIMPA